MYKWMYDRMVTEYSKKSKEELVQEIMALEKLSAPIDALQMNVRQGQVSIISMSYFQH